jgi:hypothetical protein
LSVAGLVAVLAIASLGRADWPMPGHDPARSSWASQDTVDAVLRPIWQRTIGPYIPSKVQIITVAAVRALHQLALLVSTSAVVRLGPPRQGCGAYPGCRSTSRRPWRGVVASARKQTVHALDAASGKRWQTL